MKKQKWFRMPVGYFAAPNWLTLIIFFSVAVVFAAALVLPTYDLAERQTTERAIDRGYLQGKDGTFYSVKKITGNVRIIPTYPHFSKPLKENK